MERRTLDREHEQGGAKRAVYGKAVLADLSGRLKAEFGRGFDERNLRFMRQFYLAFPSDCTGTSDVLATSKRNAVRTELTIAPPLVDESPGPAQRLPAALSIELSWTHY